MHRVLFVFIVGLCSSSAVIYHLNDTEYERMPPLTALDEYDSCLREDGATYCLLQLNLYAEPGNDLMDMITEYSNNRVKHYNHTIIDRGVCVKRTCQRYVRDFNTTAELTDSLEACLNESLRREYGLNAKVSLLYYCDQNNEAIDINTLDWLVLVVSLGFVFMNVIGSTYDYALNLGPETNAETGNAYLLSFSVMRNWRWLTSTESSDPKIRDLQPIHGVRVISNLCMILAHVMLLMATGHTKNPHDFEKTFELPFYHLIYNGMMIVQIFFFLSGFLTIYNLQIEEQKHKFTFWDIPKIMLMRFCRLTPALAASLAVALTWVRHAGSGPLWKLFVTDSLVADCHKYWWHTLLFVNNYMPDDKFCLLPTWHIAADMQVCLVGVTAYILTSGRRRRWALAGLLILGVVAPALHTVLQDLDAIVIMMPEFYRTLVNPTYRFQHILGHNNLPCFIMGMLTAIFIYERQKKGYVFNNKVYSYMLYFAVASFPLIFYSGNMFYRDGERPSLLFRAAYSGCIRLLLGVICAIGFPGLLTNTPSFMKSIFGWSFWVVPSRLSYCVYLLHMFLVHFMMGARTQLTNVNFYDVAVAHLTVVVMSYLIAIPAYLMVEAPFTMMFKNLIKNRRLQNRVEIKNGKSL